MHTNSTNKRSGTLILRGAMISLLPGSLHKSLQGSEDIFEIFLARNYIPQQLALKYYVFASAAICIFKFSFPCKEALSKSVLSIVNDRKWFWPKYRQKPPKLKVAHTTFFTLIDLYFGHFLRQKCSNISMH
jgi:hypothetical protein